MLSFAVDGFILFILFSPTLTDLRIVSEVHLCAKCIVLSGALMTHFASEQ